MSDTRQRGFFRRFRPFVVAVVLCLLTGCKSVTLIEDVTQRRANEIVAALHEKGIAASVERESGGGSAYRVEVRSEHYADALALLNQRRLLEDPPPSFEQLTAAQGLLPSSREMEALRMDYAISGQVTTLLEAHPGVVSARVLVRQNYRTEGVEPSASVVVHARASTPTVGEAEVREMLSQALPGIAPASIFLSLSTAPADTDATAAVGALNVNGKVRYIPLVPFVLGWRVPDGDYGGLALTMLTCFVIIAVVGAIAGFLFAVLSGNRRGPETEAGEPLGKSARPDRPKRDLLDF